MLTSTHRTYHWIFFSWLLIIFWLFSSAFLTHGEYGDGYNTISNGRYLYGDSLDYFSQRGPLAALAMWPVELFIDWVEWNSFDIRPYHIYSAFLHSLYLFGCFILLKSIFPGQFKNASVAPLLTLVSAIMSVTFYAFAPYLNHDIIPGMLFLLMIYLCHCWLDKPTYKIALWLVLIGSAVTFIKQTYALFWSAIIIYALVAYVLHWDKQRVSGQKLTILFVLAVISGILSWFGWGLWLVNVSPGESILIRPWLLIQTIFMLYDPAELVSALPRDLYLRNLYNYGIVAMLLVIPGLINAFYRKDACLRMVAVCWLTGVAFMQFIAFKEVRYLLFLAPLTAVLIFPIIQLVLKTRLLTTILIVLLLIDQFRGWQLVTKQLISTAGINVSRFMNAPENKGRMIVSKNLSFVYMADSPLYQDPYHGIYHLAAWHVYLMLENKVDVIDFENPQELEQIDIKAGDRLYYANVVVLRQSPWISDNNIPAQAKYLQLIAGDIERVQLVRKNDAYTIINNSGHDILFIPDKSVRQQLPIISSDVLTMAQVQHLYSDSQGQDHLNVVAVIVKALCRSEQCAYYDSAYFGNEN